MHEQEKKRIDCKKFEQKEKVCVLCYAMLCMSDIIWIFIWFLCLCVRYLFFLYLSGSYKLSLFAYKLTHAHTNERTHIGTQMMCSHMLALVHVFFSSFWRRQRKIAFICTTFTQLNTDRTSSIYWKSWWLFFKCIRIDEWESIKKKNIREFRYSPQAHARTHTHTHTCLHSHIDWKWWLGQQM